MFLIGPKKKRGERKEERKEGESHIKHFRAVISLFKPLTAFFPVGNAHSKFYPTFFHVFPDPFQSMVYHAAGCKDKATLSTKSHQDRFVYNSGSNIQVDPILLGKSFTFLSHSPYKNHFSFFQDLSYLFQGITVGIVK